MTYELRRALREALGPDITGLQRAVALEIADDARNGGRDSYASLDELVRWTGAKNADVVRGALKRLAAAGWEFRVAIGTGKDGRSLYAVPGRRMTFRVPDFKGVATAPSGRAEAASPKPEGVATAPTEGPVAPSQGAPAPTEGSPATPSSQVTQSHPSHKDAAHPADDTLPFDTPAPADADKPRRTPKKPNTPPKPNKHQTADELAAAYWERYKTSTAQTFIAIRGVIRPAINNGNDRDDVARALAVLGDEGRAISGGTLQTALQQIRGRHLRAVPGGYRPAPPADYTADYGNGF